LHLIVGATCGSHRQGGTTLKAVPQEEGRVEAGSKKRLADGADEEGMGEGTPIGFSEEGSVKVARLGLKQSFEGSNWTGWLARGSSHANGDATVERMGFRAW
jgi:hypothetical protein